MKPLFTIHAGEFLVASYIEQRFKDYLVWLPSRDLGVDLLLTDKACKRTVSIQVKFSRDFLATHMADALRPGLKACGWFTLKPQKLSQSTANFWIFVLYSFSQKELDFVIAPPSAILKMISARSMESRRPSRATFGSRRRSGAGKLADSIAKTS